MADLPGAWDDAYEALLPHYLEQVSRRLRGSVGMQLDLDRPTLACDLAADGPLPAPGTPITLDGREAGEVRSAQNDRAMAMIRLNMLEDDAGPLRAGDVVIIPRKPDWAVF